MSFLLHYVFLTATRKPGSYVTEQMARKTNTHHQMHHDADDDDDGWYLEKSGVFCGGNNEYATYTK